MKKIKILFAVIAVVVMLFTVTYAATLEFDADTVDVVDGKVVISVYAGEDASLKKSASFAVKFDASAWEYSEINNALTGMKVDASLVEDLSLIEVVFNKNDITAITAGSKVCDLTFTKKVDDAAGTIFKLEPSEELGNNLGFSAGGKGSYSDEITVATADPKPELKDTYTLGDITYTDVPNITVTKNLTSASISGDLLIDYLKDSVAYETSKAFEVVLGAFSGAGDVTFDVALINVPSTVTVTGMDIALD